MDYAYASLDIMVMIVIVIWVTKVAAIILVIHAAGRILMTALNVKSTLI